MIKCRFSNIQIYCLNNKQQNCLHGRLVAEESQSAISNRILSKHDDPNRVTAMTATKSDHNLADIPSVEQAGGRKLPVARRRRSTKLNVNQRKRRRGCTRDVQKVLSAGIEVLPHPHVHGSQVKSVQLLFHSST